MSLPLLLLCASAFTGALATPVARLTSTVCPDTNKAGGTLVSATTDAQNNINCVYSTEPEPCIYFAVGPFFFMVLV
jgi:hypothetical protein